MSDVFCYFVVFWYCHANKLLLLLLLLHVGTQCRSRVGTRATVTRCHLRHTAIHCRPTVSAYKIMSKWRLTWFSANNCPNSNHRPSLTVNRSCEPWVTRLWSRSQRRSLILIEIVNTWTSWSTPGRIGVGVLTFRSLAFTSHAQDHLWQC